MFVSSLWCLAGIQHVCQLTLISIWNTTCLPTHRRSDQNTTCLPTHLRSGWNTTCLPTHLEIVREYQLLRRVVLCTRWNVEKLTGHRQFPIYWCIWAQTVVASAATTFAGVALCTTTFAAGCATLAAGVTLCNTIRDKRMNARVENTFNTSLRGAFWWWNF